MGQQQLLLIVLGVIIVGIAIVVGINMFSASAVQANVDAISADLTNIAANAQQYWRKPTELGGGGRSFLNWTIPAKMDSNSNVRAPYTETVTATQVTIVGTGSENGADGNAVGLTAVVTADNVSITIDNQ